MRARPQLAQPGAEIACGDGGPGRRTGDAAWPGRLHGDPVPKRDSISRAVLKSAIELGFHPASIRCAIPSSIAGSESFRPKDARKVMRRGLAGLSMFCDDGSPVRWTHLTSPKGGTVWTPAQATPTASCFASPEGEVILFALLLHSFHLRVCYRPAGCQGGLAPKWP